MYPELLVTAVIIAGPSPSALLHAWDERRAEAWSQADPAVLRDLYVAGSAAGRADVAMLRSWRARGLRVDHLELQLLAVQPLRRSPGRIVLDVTDRVAGGAAAPIGLALPRDLASRHTVVLRLVAGEWRVAAVRPGPPG